MKKLVVLMTLLILAAACYFGFLSDNAPAAVSEAAAQTELYAEPAGEEAVPAETEEQSVDYDAIYALHEPDDVVMTVAGRDITWNEYYDTLRSNAMQIEDFFAQMASYYGESASWEGSLGDGSGMTYADYPSYVTEKTMTEFAAIEALAEEKNISLSEESAAVIKPENLAKEALGAEASVEELEETLEEKLHMSLEAYQRMAMVSGLYGDVRDAEYGPEGEKVPEEDIIAYLKDTGYVSANHILLMTVDSATGEELDETAAAEKKASADKIYTELASISDSRELVKRFKELKAEYCEDGGAVIFPDGYTYTPGTMVTEFEDAVNALEEYGLSEPVKSAFGYHIILRMPLGGDNLLYSKSGEPNTARYTYAIESFSAAFEQFLQENAAEYAEGFEPVCVLDYLK